MTPFKPLVLVSFLFRYTIIVSYTLVRKGEARKEELRRGGRK